MELLKSLSGFSIQNLLLSEIRLFPKTKKRVPAYMKKVSSQQEFATGARKKPVQESWEVKLDGPLEAGMNTPYSVSGRDLKIDESSWVFGDLKVGRGVIVFGESLPDGQLYARKINVKP